MWLGVIVSAIVGVICSGLVLSIALDHNPQGEFQDQETGRLLWSNLLPLTVAGFVVTAGPVAALYAAIALIIRWVNKAPAAQR